MNWIEAFILGLVQGFTEFLPVSSSGHLEIGKALLGVNLEKDMTFTIVVHGATILSIIIVFYKEIFDLIKGVFQFKWNEQLKYTLKIIISMIPVAIVGLFFKDFIESFFGGRLIFVGIMLIVTAFLLALTFYAKSTKAKRNIPYLDAFIIGIAQAIAVLPGISRSGATIATGLLLKNEKGEVAKFSFLMVLVPIIAVNILDLKDIDFASNNSIGLLPLLIGFVSAFLSGLFACKWMINLVKKGKLIYFAIYCLIIGTFAIVLG